MKNYIKELLYLIPELYRERYKLKEILICIDYCNSSTFYYDDSLFLHLDRHSNTKKTMLSSTRTLIDITLCNNTKELYICGTAVHNKNEDELFLLSLSEPAIMQLKDILDKLRNDTSLDFNHIMITKQISTELYEEIKEQIST